MALIYIEYISRRPGVDLELFHTVAGGGQSGWADDYAARDQKLLDLGRTWRMGAEPEYMAVWLSPQDGLERLDAWEAIFRSGDADHFEGPFRLAARIDIAGCYEALIDPVPGSLGRYYSEHFEIAPDATHADVRSYYEERRARHGDLELNLLCDRIGALGPDPRGLAVWGTPSFGALDTVVRELDGVSEPVRLVRAGLYCDFGQETL
jgi:hypothetical protein